MSKNTGKSCVSKMDSIEVRVMELLQRREGKFTVSKLKRTVFMKTAVDPNQPEEGN